MIENKFDYNFYTLSFRWSENALIKDKIKIASKCSSAEIKVTTKSNAKTHTRSMKLRFMIYGTFVTVSLTS